MVVARVKCGVDEVAVRGENVVAAGFEPSNSRVHAAQAPRPANLPSAPFPDVGVVTCRQEAQAPVNPFIHSYHHHECRTCT